MTSQPAGAGPGYHPGYWPWGDEPRPVPPTIPPGRERRRPTHRGRLLVLGEVLAAALVSAGVAAAMGWRVLRSLGTVVPGTGPDPFTGLWALAWSGHALRPGSGVGAVDVFEGNVFHPTQHSLAFSDSLLGYGPLTWLASGTTGPVTVYGLIFVFGPAVAALGTYALARQLGANWVGAAVAGAGFAYPPWHAGQLSHLGVLSTGPSVIALALLARGHGFTMSGRRDSPARPLWAGLGWLAAAYQLTLGWSTGLPFAYLLVGLTGLELVIVPLRALYRRGPSRDRRPRRGRLVAADLLGGVLFAGTGLLMAWPYLRVRSLGAGAVAADRGPAQVAAYSPSPLGLLTPPGVDGSWSRLWSAVMGGALPSTGDDVRLLPGLVLLALAVVGLVFSTWRGRWRVLIALAAAGLAALTLGTRFPGRTDPFTVLRHLPGWAGERVPGRLMVLGTLAVALLAAGAVSRLCGRRAVTASPEPEGQPRSRPAPGRRRPGHLLWVGLVAVLPVLVVLEGWVRIPVTYVPTMPRAIAQAGAPMVVLPSVWTNDSRVMFWSAQLGFPAVANGQSGITPASLRVLRSSTRGFPDAASVAYLRTNGYRSVVVLKTVEGVHPVAVPPSLPPLDPKLGLSRVDLGDSVLYTLDP
jgi:hypothetical protein